MKLAEFPSDDAIDCSHDENERKNKISLSMSRALCDGKYFSIRDEFSFLPGLDGCLRSIKLR